jgi:dCMP deaminase
MCRQQLKDSVYLNVAKEISTLSKDENTHVGAIIVGIDGEPVSWGYNGTIPKMDDEIIPHSREKQTLVYIEDFKFIEFEADKYPFMEHAERNAIDFGDKRKMNNATIYVTHMPCKDCARAIAKSGIKRVVVSDNNVDAGSSVGSDNNITKFIFSQKRIQLQIGHKVININKPVSQLTSEDFHENFD